MLLGEQLRAGRALLRWSQEKLAEEASRIHPVSADAIKKWEAMNGVVKATAPRVDAVMRALDAAGVELLNHGSPGARLRPSASAKSP